MSELEKQVEKHPGKLEEALYQHTCPQDEPAVLDVIPVAERTSCASAQWLYNRCVEAAPVLQTHLSPLELSRPLHPKIGAGS